MDEIDIFAHQSTLNNPQLQSENMFANLLKIKNWNLSFIYCALYNYEHPW